MSHTKPLLIPWLRAQIDSGRFPGVCWTNPEQTEFCIPWKHALRHDSSDADVLIFKVRAPPPLNPRDDPVPAPQSGPLFLGFRRGQRSAATATPRQNPPSARGTSAARSEPRASRCSRTTRMTRPIPTKCSAGPRGQQPEVRSLLLWITVITRVQKTSIGS